MKIKAAIAEDNSFLTKSLIEKLSFFEDITIKFTAENGNILLKKLEKNSNIDIILMDILIPLKNGIDATRIVKERYPRIPVIIVTAYASREIREKSFMAGCDAYLTKPILPHTLLKTVGEFIDKKEMARPSSGSWYSLNSVSLYSCRLQINAVIFVYLIFEFFS